MAERQDETEGDEIVPAVLTWFEQHRRPLPWRETTPWGVLVSEFMLQQTPVARVLPAWQAWLERWPTPASLAEASLADVLRAWGRLGYPRRAQRLQGAAAAIVERHDGQVPDDEEALRALPGVGEYTAAAVLAFAFDRRSIVLDTNVRRVLSRAVQGRALPAPHLTAGERRMAEVLWPATDVESARWAAAVMELGALVCIARAPDCPACPLASTCAWQLAGAPAPVSPPRRQKRYEGSDRQARGALLAVLREAADPVTPDALASAWPADADQRERALAALVADGLVIRMAARYCLPR